MNLRFALALSVLAGAAACSKSPGPASTTGADPIASGTPGSAVAGAEPAAKEKPRKHGDKHQPMAADAVPLTLDVSIGGAVTTWKKDAFDKVAQYSVGADGDARDVWSMRELATTLVGSGAHVVSVTGEGGAKPIDAAAWADATKTPILHTTRRGTLKFTWADSQGAWGDTVVKDVTQIEIAK